VLEPGLVIHKIYNGYWFFGRPTIEDLRQDLRAVLRKCQPDWDITKPELKAIWQQGKKELFYPYHETYAHLALPNAYVGTRLMNLVVSGMPNKQIAAELGASEATVKMHRSPVMKKMQAKSLPELVRMADKLKPILGRD